MKKLQSFINGTSNCIQCGCFPALVDDDGLCIECWEILEEYWWLVLPLECLSERHLSE